MRAPRRSWLSLALLLVPALASPAAGADIDALPLESVQAQAADGAVLDLTALADALAGADLVVIGEVHDNPLHHRIQAFLAERLAGAPGGLKGLAFEMIPEAREAAVNAARAEGRATAELAEVIGWGDLRWPDFAYYAPILAAAPEAYVAGGQPPRDALMRLAQEGLSGAPEAARFGLDAPLPDAQQEAREAGQIAAHCDALPAEMAPMLVNAQRLRDARFAAALLRAHERGGGRSALITGSGHARTDFGAPALLRRAAPERRVLSVGLEEAGGGATAPYDFRIETPSRAHLREDPCAVFERKR